MPKKQFALIFFVCFVLFGVFLFLDKQQKETVAVSQSRSLFSDLKPDSIARVNLGTKDSNVIELEFVDQSWGVASRYGYPADANHVRSLLLNVLDLSVSQKITSNNERYLPLGVDDENFKDQVTFFDANNKPLGGLLIGKERERKLEGGQSIPDGQYVRRLGEEDVFLVGQKIDLPKDAFYWLDTNLSNFLASKLSSLRQYSLKDGVETTLFELQADKDSNFKLVSETLAAKESLNPASVSKITSALENARLQDVYKSDDAKISDLIFDLKHVYQGKDGLVYTVLTAEREKKYYAKFLVEFIAEFAEEAAEAQASVSPSASPSIVASAAPEASASPVEATSEALAKEAETLNSRYSKWVYELPEYQASKFRVGLEELIQKEAEKSEDAATKQNS